MTVHYLPLPKPPLPPGQPCRVTFRSAISEDDQGSPKAIAVSITADDGDYQGVIDAVAKEGGLYASSPEAGFFFLPWPCAYVEVHPLDNSAAVVVPIDPALSEGQGELQPQGQVGSRIQPATLSAEDNKHVLKLLINALRERFQG